MIPGVNNERKIMTNLIRKDDYLGLEEQQKRLQQYGFNRE